jgi:taurine dioxygenase
MSVTTEQHVDVRPMSGYIGAELFGVDLSQPLAPAIVAEIRAALLKWKVVFFRDQHITRAQHVAFGRMFGDVTLAHPVLPPEYPEHPEILLLDNKKFGLIDGAKVESRWHTDVTFVPNPPMGSILRGVVVPEYGGDTQWSNLVVAYQELSAPMRSMLDGLHAVHHNMQGPAGSGKVKGLKEMFQAKDLQAVHPVVRVHPETGEQALFVNANFTTHIVELSKKESANLLAFLYDHIATPSYTVRFRWQPDSIAFWDNRATAHLIPTDIPVGMHRSMERITIAGDVAVGPDGSTSHALTGDSFS